MTLRRAGKILFINLIEITFYGEKAEKYLSYLGGKGINRWLLFNSINPKIKALALESVISLGSILLWVL